jgi:hypothetical protein
MNFFLSDPPEALAGLQVYLSLTVAFKLQAMNGYIWFAVVSFAVCAASLGYHVFRLIRYGNPDDFSRPLGNTQKAIRYSFTGAMNPARKESAFLHLPTYTAGILYHIGTFLSAFLFIFILLRYEPPLYTRYVIISFLVVSGSCGLAILIKRLVNQKLRFLSNPDDYISNFLVTFVHFITALALHEPTILPAYFIAVGILLLYLPLGKLKHTIYFFAARYHLGLFYGWRGTWPPKSNT